MRGTRFLLVAALLGPHDLAAQVRVVVLGTVHRFDARYPQDHAGLVRQLVALEPARIAIEVIPPDDSASLAAVRGESVSRAAQLRQERGLDLAAARARRDSLQAELATRGATPALLDRLGTAWFLSGDFLGNSDYYWIRAARLHEADPGRWGADTASRYARDRAAALALGEYASFIFPAAESLGVVAFDPIDYRVDEAGYLESTARVQRGLLWRTLIFDGRGLRAFARIRRATKSYERAEREGRLMSLVTSEGYQAGISGLVDSLHPVWSRSDEARRAQALWDTRNDQMAARIRNVAATLDRGTVLVVVGTAHVVPLVRRLAASGLDATPLRVAPPRVSP